MASYISRADAKRCIAAVHKAIAGGAHCRNAAIVAAAESLGIARTTLVSRLQPDGPIRRLYGLEVDWSRLSVESKAKPAAKPDPDPPADPIEVRRLRDRLSIESRARGEAERHAAAEKTIREAVFRLAANPLDPPSFNAERKWPADKIGEAVILPLSDLHMGEVIDLAQMGGLNSFNEVIARARLERLFARAVKLATVHWTGPPPAAFYVPLMGDLVSGEIHDELAKTNDLLSIPAVRAMSEALIGGLDLLARAFPDTPVHVVSVPGNHGRTTRKPEAKGFALDSYDTLVAWCVESWFAAKGQSQITFSAPASGDAVVNIHGWNVLFTHGDRIGSRGGAGFVGPAATIARGFQKLTMDYAAQGVMIDVIVVGHFHTALELSQGFANGCLPGPSEYSKMLRMRPEPACQWFLAIHPKHGVSRRYKIYVGHESEGSIYRGRA
jgi:hypothetical protein